MIKDWKIISIEEIAKTTSGGTPSRTNKVYYNGNILWVKSGELDDNFISDTEEKITEDAVKNSSAKLFPVGTVLMAMYGATVGKTAILKVPATTNQAVCGIIPKPAECNNEFLRFQLMFKREDFLKQRYGGAQPNISQTIIKTFDILLPPLPEQRKIAYVLSTVQKAIEQQDKLIRHTTELKKALIQKLFAEGTKGEKQKQTEIGLVPESWEVVKVGDLIQKWYGGGTPSTKNADYWNGNNPWITSKWLSEKLELENGEKFISDDGIKNSATSIVPANSLIIATRVGVGKIGINKINLSINQDLAGGQLKSKYDIYFIAYQFQLEKIQLEIESFKRGATIKGITRDNLKGIQLAIPKTKKEQLEISETIKLINRKIENYQTKKQTLSDLFKTLLHELMTGERRVHEIEFEALTKAYKIKEQPLSMAAEK